MMCLATPGRLISRRPADDVGAGPTGIVDFHGSRVEVSLACTPEAEVGDWVLVHSGFAISRLDEADARETWELLRHDERLAEAVPEEFRDGGMDG